MKPIILTFSGSIASGKTTLSKAIAEEFGWERVSFGDYVRSIALRRGLDESREVLQLIGNELIEKDMMKFCQEVIAQSSWKQGDSLVIDGIRHIEILNSLQEIFKNTKVYLVFIEVDEYERELRSLKRSSISIEGSDNTSTERQVKSIIKQSANLIVNNSQPIELVKNEITTWIQKNLFLI